jgi:transposase InsO family protein
VEQVNPWQISFDMNESQYHRFGNPRRVRITWDWYYPPKKASVGIKPIRIYPGSPWETGNNERFNGTLRREILDTEWFMTTKQA